MSKAFLSWLPLLAALLAVMLVAQTPLCLAGWGASTSCCASQGDEEGGHDSAPVKSGCCQLHAVAVAPFAPALLRGVETVQALVVKEFDLVEGLVAEIDYPPQLS